ncbi:MAG: hypothetical protein CVT88_06665 [Candidatus Altiarchaeales archaeon HGW-Altiarchaeales-1]|nr:MAG: hypothetical protein CVT88_06665 [Candidatus Altiarchaeales archaeon HGW-Altiarchaeales-1]
MSVDFALQKILDEKDSKIPLSSSALPITKTPNKNKITSKFIEVSTSFGEICPVISTIIAPNSMSCHICNLKFPICLIETKIKTANKTIIGIGIGNI